MMEHPCGNGYSQRSVANMSDDSVYVRFFFFLKCIALPERKLGVASEEPIPDVSVLVSFEKKHRLWSLFYGSPNKVARNQAGLISGFP